MRSLLTQQPHHSHHNTRHLAAEYARSCALRSGGPLHACAGSACESGDEQYMHSVLQDARGHEGLVTSAPQLSEDNALLQSEREVLQSSSRLLPRLDKLPRCSIVE